MALNIYSSAYLPFVYLLRRSVCSDILPIVKNWFVFFLLSCKSSYIFWIQVSDTVCFANISWVYSLYFIFLKMAIEEKKIGVQCIIFSRFNEFILQKYSYKNAHTPPLFVEEKTEIWPSPSTTDCCICSVPGDEGQSRFSPQHPRAGMWAWAVASEPTSGRVNPGQRFRRLSKRRWAVRSGERKASCRAVHVVWEHFYRKQSSVCCGQDWFLQWQAWERRLLHANTASLWRPGWGRRGQKNFCLFWIVLHDLNCFWFFFPTKRLYHCYF